MEQNTRRRLQRKRKQSISCDDSDDNGDGKVQKPQRSISVARGRQVLRRKRKQLSEDNEETPACKYRTPKHMTERDDYESDKSVSSRSSTAELSDKESSDGDGWSTWSSDESDGENKLKKDLHKTDDIASDQSADDFAKEKNEREKYKKACETEESVVSSLKAYWMSHVARKLSEQACANQSNVCNPAKLTELHCFAAKKFSRLPLVLSVGVEKNNGKINIHVSDRKKAAELSKELQDPSLNLVEARYTHFI